MYAEIRRCMAVDFPEDSDPEIVQEPRKELRDMKSEECEFYRKELEEQERQIRNGYQRIKQKVKSVRQDYRSAVNKGTRSGSGKVVQNNSALLTEIWKGSPSTTSLLFGIDGEVALPSGTNSNLKDEGSVESSPCAADTSTNSSEAAATGSKGKHTINVSNIPKLVDSKRRHMEKSLSEAQRDQLLMPTAKEDLLIKKKKATNI
ncbi:uncharacterized protein [Montipora capricornis]|uniref:uncharacterized protein n=1 Tax=Montipora capricornis TaxID=246305 RepID=UPI0035F15DDD